VVCSSRSAQHRNQLQGRLREKIADLVSSISLSSGAVAHARAIGRPANGLLESTDEAVEPFCVWTEAPNREHESAFPAAEPHILDAPRIKHTESGNTD
jgi:hypothetical protein